MRPAQSGRTTPMENNKNKRGLARAAPPATDSAAGLAAPPPGSGSLPRSFLPSSQARTLKQAAIPPSVRRHRASPAEANLKPPPNLLLLPPPLTSPQGEAVSSLAPALPRPAWLLLSWRLYCPLERGHSLWGAGILFLSSICLGFFRLKPEYYYTLHPLFLISRTARVFSHNFKIK